MTNERITMELKICKIILDMDRPFKISQLLAVTSQQNITNDELVLDVLGQLCESGIIKYSEIQDDVWAYRKIAS